MKLALACVTGLVVASAAEAAPDPRPQRLSSVPQRAPSADLWSLQQLTDQRDMGQRLPSPSQLDELMDGLPLISDRADADASGKGFSFKVKPGKGVTAVARLRFSRSTPLTFPPVRAAV